MRRGSCPWWLPVAVVAIGCTAEPPPPDPAVAWVDDAPVLRSELERYLEENLIEGAPDELSPDEHDLVRSRLLDALIDERMLSAEATRRGLWVSDLEIESFLGLLDEEPVWDADELHRRRQLARSRLKIQKLEESVALDQPPVDQAALEAYQAANSARLIPGKRVEVRSLRLSSSEEAQRIDRDLRQGRRTFDEVVAAHREDPGQGRATLLAWDGLAEQVRTALEGLRPGRVTGPVKWNGEVYLFQVVAWREPDQSADAAAVETARSELEAQRRRQAYKKLMVELRARCEVRLDEAQLPFRYIPPQEL